LKFEGFKETNGTVLLLGDRSHPTSAELVINYPDWAERNENMVKNTSQLLASVMSSFPALMEQQKQVAETLASLNGVGKAKPMEMRFYE
jgi:hypothetical protein